MTACRTFQVTPRPRGSLTLVVLEEEEPGALLMLATHLAGGVALLRMLPGVLGDAPGVFGKVDRQDPRQNQCGRPRGGEEPEGESGDVQNDE
jgi:hypothetical protein